MFAQLTILHCADGRLDDLAGRYRQHLVPLTQAQLGYRGLYLLLDRATGKVVALSLWDSVEDARAYTASDCYQDHLAALGTCLARTPDYEGYEVGVDA
jgi:heme-degrading monooxygenase HmoA